MHNITVVSGCFTAPVTMDDGSVRQVLVPLLDVFGISKSEYAKYYNAIRKAGLK